MKKLIEKAKAQFSEFGKIEVTHYYDRSYQNLEKVTFYSLAECIEFIEDILSNDSDEDLHISCTY